MSTTPLTTDYGAMVFAGHGEMQARCRAMDWAATPLGPVSGWSQSLRTTVGTVACWWSGENESTTAARMISNVEHAAQVVVGATFGCELERTGEVRCWGNAPDAPQVPRAYAEVVPGVQADELVAHFGAGWWAATKARGPGIVETGTMADDTSASGKAQVSPSTSAASGFRTRLPRKAKNSDRPAPRLAQSTMHAAMPPIPT